MLSRRELVGRIAAGTAAAACVTGLTGVSAAAVRRVNRPEQAGEVADAAESQVIVDAEPPATTRETAHWAMLSPLAPGAEVAHGWTVVALSAVVDGACVVTLRNGRGREHRVHICRNDGQPQGVVHTDRLDLIVMNGGRGDLVTEEGLAQAVAELAHVLARNDAQLEPVLAGLMAQRARVEQFSGMADRRLR